MFGFLALAISGEILLLFDLLEEPVILAFEWAHKTLDIFYADIIGLDHEKAPKASAWTGLFLLIGLLGWGGYKLYQTYLKAKAAAPLWWAEKKSDLNNWWADLPWHLKLAYIAGGLVMIGVLGMFI